MNVNAIIFHSVALMNRSCRLGINTKIYTSSVRSRAGFTSQNIKSCFARPRYYDVLSKAGNERKACKHVFVVTSHQRLNEIYYLYETDRVVARQDINRITELEQFGPRDYDAARPASNRSLRHSTRFRFIAEELILPSQVCRKNSTQDSNEISMLPPVSYIEKVRYDPTRAMTFYWRNFHFFVKFQLFQLKATGYFKFYISILFLHGKKRICHIKKISQLFQSIAKRMSLAFIAQNFISRIFYYRCFQFF